MARRTFTPCHDGSITHRQVCVDLWQLCCLKHSLRCCNSSAPLSHSHERPQSRQHIICPSTLSAVTVWHTACESAASTERTVVILVCETCSLHLSSEGLEGLDVFTVAREIPSPCPHPVPPQLKSGDDERSITDGRSVSCTAGPAWMKCWPCRASLRNGNPTNRWVHQWTSLAVAQMMLV